MGAAENKETVRGMFAALSQGNAEGFLGKFADDCRFTIIGETKYSGTCKGKQEFIANVLAPLSAKLEGGIAITVDNLIADGDFVAMQGRGKSNTKAGGTYNNTYCQVFRFGGGKIVEMTEYLDTELVTKAFGK